MGNHRFKLSDMMPNAWFYKLRDMSKVRSQSNKHNMQSSTQNPRRSFYYTSDSRLCLSPPTTKKRARRKTVYMPSPRKEPPTSSDRISLSGFDQSYLSSSASDIIIDVDDTSIHIDTLTEFHLPPIHTKPRKDSSLFHDTSIQFPPEKPRRSRRSPGSRKSFSGGVKIRGTARTVTGKNPEGRRRKNVEGERKKGMFYSESFAIVKASFDPEKDFKESMMEMIVENNIRASKDLEELLACYLSLNSNQYHDMIIKAFEQIWFSMAQHHF